MDASKLSDNSGPQPDISDEITKIKAAVGRETRGVAAIAASSIQVSVQSDPTHTAPPAGHVLVKVGRKVETWVLVLGFAAALLGGFLGIIIGVSIWRASVKVDGVKVRVYDESSRRLGLAIFVTSLVAFIVWTIVMANR
jgi:hypothetical protein